MINKLNPNFNKFICSIGELPLSYKESLSYEEQLLWFSQMLEEVINNMECAIGVNDYETLITELNDYEKDDYHIGQTFKIKTLNVADLWISDIKDEKIEFNYISDEDVLNKLKTNGKIQVGYFELMSIETLLDLSNYYTKTEIDSLLNESLSNYELLSNKVNSISSTSTDDEYPSAKCMYDIVGNIESLLGEI